MFSFIYILYCCPAGSEEVHQERERLGRGQRHPPQLEPQAGSGVHSAGWKTSRRREAAARQERHRHRQRQGRLGAGVHKQPHVSGCGSQEGGRHLC